MLCQQHEHLVARNEAAALVHRHHAVGIAVVSNADGAQLAGLPDQVAQVRLDRLDRVRKGPRWPAVELDNLCPQAAQQLRRDDRCRPTGAIEHHLDLAGQLHAAENMLDVLRHGCRYGETAVCISAHLAVAALSIRLSRCSCCAVSKLEPSGLKTLMPLYSGGLCEAVTITPA